MFRLQLTKNKLALLYKLLNDLLFLLIIFFALTLIAEGLIPGIISAHISFSKIILLLTVNILAIYITGSLSSIDIGNQKLNKKITLFLVILSILLIANSLFKLNLFLAVFILIFIIFLNYFIYKIIIN